MKKSLSISLIIFVITLIGFSVNIRAQSAATDAKPFIKHWKGQWEDTSNNRKGPMAELIVEENILSYKCDPYPSWKLRGVDFRNVPYEIKGDVLSFQSLTSGKTFIFKLLDGGGLEGHRSDDPISRVVLK